MLNMQKHNNNKQILTEKKIDKCAVNTSRKATPQV